jgi:subfamily B ATP-binding cassette protein MsbA
MRLSPSHFERETTGSSLSRVTGDVAALQQTLGPQLADLAKAPLSILFGLAVMVSASWQLTLTVLIMAPVIAVVVGVGGRKIRKITTLMQERLGALNASLVERLANVRIIQSFVRERHESAQVAHFNEQYYRDTMRSVLVAEIIAPTSELIAIGMLVGVIVGGLAVFHGQLTPSQFVLFLTMGQQVGSQFKHLTRLNQLREQANGAGARIFELLDIEPEIADAQRAVLLPPVQGRVTFEDVSFSYSTGAEVLSHVTLEVTPGEVIAVVGPTGSGKSTLVNLLPRFYDPTGGRILVDGHDVRAITLGSLRSQVGIVPQETVLFTGTIADNIRYGRLEASDAEVEEAARAAQALEFIVRQADGFDTMVGERGATLSGGQRQRVAIARALLKNPRILILDEATSALDTESEHLVQQALERLMQERTTFVIAHRLSTIQNATRIVVLEQGRIVEVGSHAALLAHDGLYRRLYDMQFRAAVDLAAEAPVSATP